MFSMAGYTFSIINAVILLIFTLFFAIRSYRRGLWRSLLSLTGLGLAYLSCFFLALPFALFLQNFLGLNAIIAFPLSLLIIFSVVVMFFSNFLWLVFSNIELSRKHKILAVPLGIVFGAVLGLFSIWTYYTASILFELKNDAQQSDIASPANRTKDPIEKAAVALVKTTLASAVAIIDKGASAPLLSAFVEDPLETAAAAKELVQSQKLQNFWNDEGVMLKMANNEVDQLMDEFSFQDLANAPSMQTILNNTKVDDFDHQRHLAEQLTYLWRRMRYIRSDERVQNILADPDFQALVDKQNPIALLADENTQALIKIILQDENMDDFDFVKDLTQPYAPANGTHGTVDTEQGKPAQATSTPPSAPDIVYQWRDKHGKIQYTTFENIPLDKRAQARKFTQ